MITSSSRRVIFIAAGGYVVLTLLLTWPTALHWGSGPAGFDGRDSLQYVWSLWWGGKAWGELGISPDQLTYLYHPRGAYHALLSATPLLEITSIPLRHWLSPIAVYNTQFVLSFVLCGMAVFILALEQGLSAPAAFVSGSMFAFAPHRMGHATAGHLTQLAGSLGVFCLVGFTRFGRQPRLKHAVFTGVTLGLSLLVSPLQSAYFVVPLCLCYVAFLCLRQRERLLEREYLVGWLSIIVITSAIAAPFTAKLISNQGSASLGYLRPRDQESLNYSVDLLALLFPSPYHPVVRALQAPLPSSRVIPAPTELEHTAYLGWIPVALAVVATTRRWKQSWPWSALLLLSMIFALGPVLQAGRQPLLLGSHQVPLPYGIVERLPFYQWGRTPERLFQLSSLALALLVGIALSLLGRRRPPLSRTITLVLSALILVEYVIIFPFPAPMTQIPVPVRLMAEDKTPYAVADIPIAKRQVSNYAMLYQTYHGHPIIGGYIHRDPPGTRAWSKAFDALFRPGDDASPPLTSLEGAALLRGLGIGRVLAHRHFVDAPDAAEMVRSLRGWLGPPTYSDTDIVLFSVPDADYTAEPSLSGSEIQFGGQLILDGLDVQATGSRLDVVLTWGTATLPTADYVVVLDVLDENGRPRAGISEAPLRGRWPTRLWSPGETLVDMHSLSLPGDLPAGCYDVAVGMIDDQTSQPLAVRAEGLPVREGRVVVTNAYCMP
jgi:hypothetical protein